MASADGYKYSKALTGYGGTWTPERLDAFLTKPKAEVKGTSMGFSGLKKPVDRTNLIAYLSSFSNTPPAAAAAPAEAPQASQPEEYEFGVLFDAPGVEETFYACSACHSERIVAQQGLTRSGWKEVLTWMVEEQDMTQIDEPDYSTIIDYLSANYGEDRPNFPKPGN